MIETEQLTKYFDDFRAVDRVTLHVEPGEVLAMLGPNGAGKTTTVRMMTSILAPTSGSAQIAGFDVVKQPERVREHVGVLTEQHGLYERMKGLDYLDFFGQVYHMPRDLRQRRALDLMARFGLEDALDRRIGEYSKGMKQKLALVRAMIHDPRVLLLDEPTSAMDPQSAKQVRDAIIDLQKGERTFLITTHNLTEAQLLADRIAIIRRGRIIANGTIDELAQHFIGQPRMELRINGSLNGLASDLTDLVDVASSGPNWLQYHTPDPYTANPQVLARCAALGVAVVTLSPLTQTLEDIYLQVVAEDEAQLHQPDPSATE
ncbi:ABC transporter ATP-binding protein [Phototrophicus methaneseepsis]|uniref:ABC transporter ATP-binding protein n=1 Tax=Phototrophicus methaneseepsis TaxID=2710758 RepID=A0A7S8IH32_9CHLR|nr:ABC transporter ATP-binding protein [Phototrophicus methaneseepsis]QPC84913.1 ABC transporter ATP-binding protein [Phototrophicus methaneseepsis]